MSSRVSGLSARLEAEVASFAEDVPPGTAIQNVCREGLLFARRADHSIAFRLPTPAARQRPPAPFRVGERSAPRPALRRLAVHATSPFGWPTYHSPPTRSNPTRTLRSRPVLRPRTVSFEVIPMPTLNHAQRNSGSSTRMTAYAARNVSLHAADERPVTDVGTRVSAFGTSEGAGSMTRAGYAHSFPWTRMCRVRAQTPAKSPPLRCERGSYCCLPGTPAGCLQHPWDRDWESGGAQQRGVNGERCGHLHVAASLPTTSRPMARADEGLAVPRPARRQARTGRKYVRPNFSFGIGGAAGWENLRGAGGLSDIRPTGFPWPMETSGSSRRNNGARRRGRSAHSGRAARRKSWAGWGWPHGSDLAVEGPAAVRRSGGLDGTTCYTIRVRQTTRRPGRTIATLLSRCVRSLGGADPAERSTWGSDLGTVVAVRRCSSGCWTPATRSSDQERNSMETATSSTACVDEVEPIVDSIQFVED